MDVQRTMIISILLIIGPIGTTLNVIIIWTLKKSGLLKKRLYIIYLNLAICDSINAAIGSLLSVSVYVTGEFPQCRVVMVVMVLCYVTSVGTITFLSYDRFVVLNWPLKANKFVTKAKTLIVLGSLWALGIINSTLVVTDYTLRPIISAYSILDRKNCVVARLYKRDFILTVCYVLIMLPTIVTILLNIQILHVAGRHHRKHTKSMSGQKGALYQDKWNFKAARTTARIVAANILCTIPFVLVVVIEVTCKYCVSYKKIKTYYTLFILNFLSTILNPVIYSWTNLELRRAVRSFLKSFCCMSKKDQKRSVVSTVTCNVVSSQL